MRKVLIAEDEVLLQKALHKIITEQTDLDICFKASNGKEAFHYLYKHKVDILITDIRMPVMDGLELITRIKEAGITVKTIVVSGYNDFEYAKHMLKHGAFSYLLKPLVTEELLETLLAACETLKEEEEKRNIIKSHQFDTLQQKKYVHFTDEMPPALLHSKALFSCCIDFEDYCDKDAIALFQRELEIRCYPGCCFLLDTYLYLITTLDEPGKDRIEIVTDLQAYFSHKRFSVKIGIGLTVSSMMEVNQSMKQARKALCYYEHLAYNKFVDYERISLLGNPTLPYPLTEEKNLLESINYHEADEIQKNIDQLKIYFSGQNKDTVFHMLTELVISCKRELQPYKLTNSDWEDMIAEIQHRQPWDGILFHLQKVLLDIQHQLIENRKSGSHNTIFKAKQYIKDHASRALTLEDVANECYLSKSHFCKIFKEETGLTFKSYLNGIRIDSAKILLKTTDLRNYEIAIAIGLEDASYFNELFKKITGLTPTEFRDQ